MKNSRSYRIADCGDSEGSPGGVAVAQAARKHGISAATCVRWKSKFAGACNATLQPPRPLHEAA